jgi:hypothetical protein
VISASDLQSFIKITTLPPLSDQIEKPYFVSPNHFIKLLSLVPINNKYKEMFAHMNEETGYWIQYMSHHKPETIKSPFDDWTTLQILKVLR